jgi:serpin B
MPRWKTKSEFKLGEVLSTMGMSDAFDSSLANFSGINGDGDLFVSGVIHQAFIEVKESGTEAAAATGIVVDGNTSVEPTPISVRLDRPFIYLIRDIPTQTVLFVGNVNDPTQQ